METATERDQALVITVGEAARMLGIGRNLAYVLAASGELPGVRKLGGRYVVSRVALLQSLAADPR